MNAGLNLVRFFLAFNVVLFHLWNAAAPGAGPVAVLGFFFTSGYLITQIVQEVYRPPGRTWSFLLNRSLRIYPQYLAALGLGLLAIAVYPDAASHINSYMRWPQTAGEWRDQFDMFGLIDSGVRVLPATWTLGTELYFYLVIGLVTARSRRASIALCALSLPLGLLCAAGVLPFAFYGSAVGNGFVFALGSVAYFYRDAVRIGLPLFLLACAAYLAHVYLVPSLEQADLDKANLAGSVLPFAVILLYLVQHPGARAGWPARIAAVLGKIAYPMFLLHWAVCVVLSAWLFHGLASFDMQGARQGAGYFGAMFAGVLACSLLFYLLIDQPVERWRRVIRRGAAGRRAARLVPGAP
ncbi:acyltransferase family protein [Caenimonas terrae]|uniref:Acyltransferase family protein n=1 Tax=Caenimonas terrae TaxID=696074 RepID=A0ABW0NCJ2_9BURK